MPKTLFYAAVVACVAVGGATVLSAFSSEVFARLSGDPVTAILLLIVAIPLSAVFLRMASLLAARNLFAAFLAIFSIGGAGIAVSLVALTQLRMLAPIPVEPETLEEIHVVASLLVGWFLSAAFLVLRPYFRLQASPLLSALVVLPAPIFLWSRVEQLTIGPSGGFVTFLAILGMLFVGVALHCLHHRHLFLEITNLRELLTGRALDRARGPRRVAMGDVAFDS